MPSTLLALFVCTAMLYAAVGFGGGSTYNALLVLYGVDYRILPLIALSCNIVVVSGGVWRYGRAGELSVYKLVPFIVASVPAAWWGGQLLVSEAVFVFLLGGALLIAGLQLLWQRDAAGGPPEGRPISTPMALVTGGSIGLLAGVVGVGGGIFLAPILYFMRFGSPRQIAAACSLFILVNSASGAMGQLMKLSDLSLLALAQPYWPLIPAVLLGGQVGSWLSVRGLEPLWIKRLTAVLVLYVAARLLLRWAAMIW